MFQFRLSLSKAWRPILRQSKQASKCFGFTCFLLQLSVPQSFTHWQRSLLHQHLKLHFTVLLFIFFLQFLLFALHSCLERDFVLKWKQEEEQLQEANQHLHYQQKVHLPTMLLMLVVHSMDVVIEPSWNSLICPSCFWHCTSPSF